MIDEMPNVTRIDLEKHRISAMHMIGARALHDMSKLDAERMMDHLTGALVLKVTKSLYGREANRTVEETILIPLTWWDHLKKTVLERFPRAGWFVRTIKTKPIDVMIKEIRVCPHIPQNDRDVNRLCIPYLQGEPSPGFVDRVQDRLDAESAKLQHAAPQRDAKGRFKS